MILARIILYKFLTFDCWCQATQPMHRFSVCTSLSFSDSYEKCAKGFFCYDFRLPSHLHGRDFVAFNAFLPSKRIISTHLRVTLSHFPAFLPATALFLIMAFLLYQSCVEKKTLFFFFLEWNRRLVGVEQKTFFFFFLMEPKAKK